MYCRRGAFSSVAFWWLFFVVLNAHHDAARGQAGICDMKGCKCVDKSGGWKVVNCTFAADQKLVFESDSIDKKLLEIFIVGGNSVVFKERSFNALPGLSILYIGSVTKVVVKTHAFFNPNSPSLRFDVENCDKLVVESEAFINSNSTIITDFNKIEYCMVQSSAFSKLVNATFQNISKLDLVERSFEITKKDGIVRHGPATKITFNKVRITAIPSWTFFSPLAEIRILNSRVGEIHSNAFSATQINMIYMLNTTIETVKAEACPQLPLIENFKISKCNISRLESRAVLCAISKLSILNSRIRVIESGAINTTSAIINLVGNEIVEFKSAALGFCSFNRIVVEQNMIKNLGADSISIYGETNSQESPQFSFINNDIFNLDVNSLSFVANMDEGNVVFEENYFNVKCSCFMNSWLEKLLKTNRTIDDVMNSSFCAVDDLLARCYELKTGLINMMNFTDLVCAPGNVISCEPYKGEEKIVNITDPVFLDAPPADHSRLILFLTIGGLLIIAIVSTFFFLLFIGGRWVKRNWYLRNMHYSPNETSNDEENTIVTIDQESEEAPKMELPEELTLEYLEYLKQRLNDPETHQETTEMIEKLYEMFVIEDNYDNNNKQDEEAHLYEELANMQQQPGDRKSTDNIQNGPHSILRMMEERFNLQFMDTEDERSKSTPFLNDYSEPSDAAVHLYSELKQNQMQNEKNEKKDSLKSRGSGSMAARPLPNKPDDNFNTAGPSSID